MAQRGRLDLRRMRTAAAKLATLGVRGWWLLAEAQAAILRAEAQVRHRPRGDILRELSASDGPPAPAFAEDRERVETIGLAVERVARLGIGRPLCLARSIALHHLLVKHGVRGSRIRVGVRMQDRAFQAHAWVEWNGTVVAEDPAFVARFSPFPDLGPAAAALSWTMPGSAT